MNSMKTTNESVKLAGPSSVGPCHPGLPLTVVGHVLNYTTLQKFEFVNLTELVEERVGETGILDGWRSFTRFIPPRPSL